jgi:hypothetical protein
VEVVLELVIVEPVAELEDFLQVQFRLVLEHIQLELVVLVDNKEMAETPI